MAEYAFKLDAQHDLAIENARFATVSGREQRAQKIDIKLNDFRGEWFLDQNYGTPWYQEVLGVSGRQRSRPEDTVTRSVLEVRGVQEMDEPAIALLNRERRVALVWFAAVTDNGVVEGVTTT